MTKVKDDRAAADALADALLLCAGAGLVSSSLMAMMAATDAFSQLLLGSAHQSAQVSALQVRSLAQSLADLQPPRQPTTNLVRTEKTGLPPGWPVVT